MSEEEVDELLARLRAKLLEEPQLAVQLRLILDMADAGALAS